MSQSYEVDTLEAGQLCVCVCVCVCVCLCVCKKIIENREEKKKKKKKNNRKSRMFHAESPALSLTHF